MIVTSLIASRDGSAPFATHLRAARRIVRVKMRGSARTLRGREEEESMPVWAWILIIIVIVLLLGGGYGYRRRG